LKYASEIVVIIGASALGIDYLLMHPNRTTKNQTTATSTSSTTQLPLPIPEFNYRTADRTLLFVNPISSEEIQFHNVTDDSAFSPPLAYEWSVDGEAKSTDRDYSTKLTETQTSKVPHIIKLTAKRGRETSSTNSYVDVDPESLPQYTSKKLNIPVKGVVYRVGYRSGGWHPAEDETRECMWVTRNELGCNSVLIMGVNDQVILEAGRIAAQEGIDTILLSPRAYSETYSIDEHVKRIIKFSKSAETLRTQFPGIVLVVGNELTIDTMGLLKSPTYRGRIKEWEQMNNQYQVKLNEYLQIIVDGVRKNFHGKITYASAVAEASHVPWNKLGFDIIAPHLYMKNPDGNWNDESALKRIRTWQMYKKPLWISEFGCGTYKGASAQGSSSWMSSGSYDQGEQADNITHSVNFFNGAKVDGIFLYVLFEPKADDAQSFGILKYVGTQWNGPDSLGIQLRRKQGFYVYQSYRRTGKN